MPLLRLPVYSGAVTGVSGFGVDISQSVGLLDKLAGGSAFFVEITSGEHEGERFEVDLGKCTDATLSLKAAQALPESLLGAQMVVRPHWTLASLLPPERFQATTSPLTADRVLFYENGSYSVHWLLNAKSGAKWVRSGDSKLADAGATRVISPDEGLLVQCRGMEALVPLVGEVRTHAWVESLPAGSHLTGSGLPYAVSPDTRALTLASGLVAGDRLLLWTGDQTPGSNAFINLTLSATGWVRDVDQAIVSHDLVLEPFRASYLVNAQPVLIKRQP